jgi:hypothetical protein
MSKQITFRRAKHDKEHPFVMISKAMFRDKSISFKAKGLLGYLLCLPDNFKVNPKQIAKAMEVGEEQIYSGLKELMKIGYCNRIQEKDSTGRFSLQVYEFSEEPIFQNPQNPDLEKPKTVESTSKGHKEELKEKVPHPQNPDLDKCPIKDNEVPSKQKKGKYIVKIKFKEFVELSQEQYDNLQKLYGIEKFTAMLDYLDYYKGAHGKKYDSDFHVMKQGGWLEKHIDKEKKALSDKPKNQSKEEQNKEKTLKRFKHGQVYAGATFWTTDAACAFNRGQTNYQLAYKEYSFDNQLQSILLKLGIT